MLKKRFKSLFEKKLFKTLSLKLFLTDGSVITTDPVSYKKFKEVTSRIILGEEVRVATTKDYKEHYDLLIESIKNPEDVEFFTVSISGRSHNIPSSNILKIEKIQK